MTEERYTLPEWIKPGVKFRVFYGEGNVNNRVMHVRGVVDGWAVVRSWSRAKQRWNYTVKHPVFFAVNEDCIIPEGKP